MNSALRVDLFAARNIRFVESSSTEVVTCAQQQRWRVFAQYSSLLVGNLAPYVVSGSTLLEVKARRLSTACAAATRLQPEDAASTDKQATDRFLLTSERVPVNWMQTPRQTAAGLTTGAGAEKILKQLYTSPRTSAYGIKQTKSRVPRLPPDAAEFGPSSEGQSSFNDVVRTAAFTRSASTSNTCVEVLRCPRLPSSEYCLTT